MQESLTQVLAEAWAPLRLDDLPPAVLDQIKDHILDTVAVTLACSHTKEAQTARRAFGRFELAGSRSSSVWGTSLRLAPSQAAFINGTTAHSRDYDDGGSAGHPGAIVLPAVLATAEVFGLSGRAVLEATVAGYDIGQRVMYALGGYPVHFARGWHSSGTVGSFAAAGGAAKCLGLGSAEFASALGIAGSFTGGVWAFMKDAAMTKRMHTGKAAETGLEAALLAAEGFTGPRWIFEAEWGGVYSTYNGGISDPATATAEVGTRFDIHEWWTKPYACCRGSHSAIDAVLDFAIGNDLSPDDFERIDIRASQLLMKEVGKTSIATVFDAQFSMPYAVAVAVCRRRAGLAEFDPPQMGDRAVQDVFDRITMRFDEALPDREGPQLDITLRDGTTTTLVATRAVEGRGSFSNDGWGHAQIVDKARTLLDPLIGDSKAVALISAIETLEEASDVRGMMEAISA